MTPKRKPKPKPQPEPDQADVATTEPTTPEGAPV
jgi:hypothetical protein